MGEASFVGLGSGLAMLLPVWLPLALVLVMVIAAFRKPPRAPETPRQILDRRLASGEITAKEHAHLLALTQQQAMRIGTGAHAHPAAHASAEPGD